MSHHLVEMIGSGEVGTKEEQVQQLQQQYVAITSTWYLHSPDTGNYHLIDDMERNLNLTLKSTV